MNFFFGGGNSNGNGGSNRNRQQQQQQPPPFFSPEAFQDFARQHQASGQEGGFGSIFDAFQMAAAQAASMNDQGGESANTGAPPASRKTIRQLPTVVVTPEDLVDETNRECCICLEENELGAKVARLPCGHIFHTHCINQWLTKHCTCPVCRYELPTDDSGYERGRKQRMALRKPRYAKYELQRMTVTELNELCRTIRLDKKPRGFFSVCSRKRQRGSSDEGISTTSGNLMDKEDLIDMIMESGKIDVIAAPEPVEYDSISDLRSMGVGKLKKAMTAAGVFFDAKDVVEKEDMVQIFVNSGRIVFANPEQSDQKMEYTAYDATVEPTTTATETEALSPPSEQPDNPPSPSHSATSSQGGQTYNTSPPSNTASYSRVEQTYTTPPSNATSSRFLNRTVGELRQLAAEIGADISDCLEKKEMVDRIVSRLDSR